MVCTTRTGATVVAKVRPECASPIAEMEFSATQCARHLVGPALSIPNPIQTSCCNGVSVSIYSYVDTSTHNGADHYGIGTVLHILRAIRPEPSSLVPSATIESDLAFATHWNPRPTQILQALFKTSAFMTAFTRILDAYQPVLSHGDLNPENVFIENQNTGQSIAPIVLDWELGSLAVPHRDAAVFLVQLALGSPVDADSMSFAGLLREFANRLGFPLVEMAAAVARELCFRNEYEMRNVNCIPPAGRRQPLQCLAWLDECISLLRSMQ